MNRRVLIEEIPDGRLVISTNFASGRPGPDMSVATISTRFMDLARDLDRLLDEPVDDAFQEGMRRVEHAKWLALRAERTKARTEGQVEDDIPF